MSYKIDLDTSQGDDASYEAFLMSHEQQFALYELVLDFMEWDLGEQAQFIEELRAEDEKEAETFLKLLAKQEEEDKAILQMARDLLPF